ncbi:DNA gyrase subunit A [Candidatus Obscuribacterales bacterium]|nr:DNA gyrase subunit A [Candidatus Obscuribacterales bacterium]MBX3137005.1 DNA gyrase subunit A [Candidatus Obscuribacterales bacterium]MBX3153253.1 DNA gyrase subunit A [Candidatus Obscuribacterales bacterium]
MTSSTGSGGGGGERIVEVELRDEMRKSFIDYAMSVIVSRAIPDVRDGLKPVHRRIIFGMYELGLEPNTRYRKSALTVGDVMGKYHPHGDSAIYESMVRLAQKEASRYVLIDGHGNFGDLDNPAAAMRYTEAKLAPLSMQMLADIDKETIDMRRNFDESRDEPSVLPSRVPALLLNGSAGIAVGMATNIPPHNLREVMDGAIALVDDPNLSSTDLMQWIKGPDFPSGGMIMGTEGIVEAYTTGRGSIPQRGVATIEQTGKGNKMAIAITSLPYMVGPEAFTKRVAELVRSERLTGISDVNDETDRSGLRVVVELKRDAHPEVVLNNLYKHTQLQQSFPVNTLALVPDPGKPGTNGQPMTLELKALLQQFINHRVDVITRRTRYDLRKAQEKAHILEGYLKALEKIDEVIKIIRAASTTAEAREGLMSKFALSEAQANAILEMQLRRLTGLERDKIQEDYDELQKNIAHYKAILESKKMVDDIIKQELIEIRDKYGDDRKTQIVGAVDSEISAKDLTPNEPMAVFITNQNYIKRIALGTFKRQRRNTRGVTGMKTRDEDEIQHFFVASMHDRLLVFTNKGQVYPLEVMNLPEGGRTARGLALVNLVQISQDESVTAVIPVSEFKDNEFLIMLTRNAFVKKVPMSEFSNIRKSGIIAISLSEGDELGWVRQSNGKTDVIIGTSNGMCIRYSEEELRPMGRTARGVRAITLRVSDTIVGCDAIEPKDSCYVLVVTNDGYGKRVKLEEFRQQGRGGVGIIGTKFKTAKSRLACLSVIEPTDQIVIATANGVVVRQHGSDISAQGRMATGVRLQQLAEDDEVVSVSPIVDPNESEIEGGDDVAEGGAEGGDAPEAEGGSDEPAAE